MMQSKAPKAFPPSRKVLLVAGLVLFAAGFSLVLAGTYRPDENLPEKVRFATSPSYADKLNSFFNRTTTTAREDARNKLVEDYTVAGYLIRPTAPPPPSGYPVVVWMHGFGVSAELQLNYPRQLAKAGFLVLAVDQPGHGDSGGYWDMGIQTLLGVYSAVEWVLSDPGLVPLVDPARVGVSGHSMGGVAATRAAIFDNWTFTAGGSTPGERVGTGGKIRSCLAVYCWDDLGAMSNGLVEEYTGVVDAWNHPTIRDLMDHWRWLSNRDSSVLEEEVRLRSVSNFISGTNAPNYYLITGGDDELTTTRAQYYLAANATRDESGAARASWESIRDEVEASSDHTWSYGNVADGTARRLTIVPAMDHLREAFSRTVAKALVDWFAESMNCTGIDRYVPAGEFDWQAPFLLKLLGWGLMLAAVPPCVLSSLAYYFTTRQSREGGGEEGSGSDTGRTGSNGGGSARALALGVASALGVAASGLPSLDSVTHFWVYDLLVSGILLGGLILSGIVAAFAFLERKTRGKVRGGLQELAYLPKWDSNAARDLAFPVAILLGWLLAFDSCGFFQLPYVWPRPASLQLALDVATLLGSTTLFFVASEFVFRGVAQDAFGARVAVGRDGTRGRTVVLESAGFSGVCLGAGAGTALLARFGPLFAGAPQLAVGMVVGLIAAFFGLGVVAAWIRQRTGNFLAGALFSAVLVTLAFSGKLFMPYA
ncbi:MAG: alpha/beta hydrolase family protein [Promethearchaeota archaeon]